jgi:hypothetical protein
MELGPEDLRTVALGLVAWGIPTFVAWLYRKYRASSIESDIRTRVSDKEHLQAMSECSTEMNRRTFMAIFGILMLFSIAECLSHLARFIDEGLSYYSLVAAMLYCVIALVCNRMIKEYKDLKNIKAVVERIDKELEALNKKL